jgi:hypothetical protein
MEVLTHNSSVYENYKNLMDELKDYLDYCPESGTFVWKRNYKLARKGDSPQPSHSEGYLRVQFKGVRFFLHKVAFYWSFGVIPKEIDHINRDTTDNRLSNLRAATQLQNSANKSSRGFSKYRGVYYHRKNKKWCACGVKYQVKHYLGTFNTEEEAAVAYNTWAKEFHGEFANLNVLSGGVE